MNIKNPIPGTVVSIVFLLWVMTWMIFISCGTDRLSQGSTYSEDPAENRKARISRVLLTQKPILLLDIKAEDQEAVLAQDLVVNDPRMQEYYFEKGTDKPMLSEVFSVSPMRPSDQAKGGATCQGKGCYRVEIYHYSTNSMIMALVNTEQKKLMDLSFYRGFQPDLPPHLGELAVWIATHDSTVILEYGGKAPDKNQVRMPTTKTALNRTKCQRSQHLCVAPTFVRENKALWVIVDLTDLKIAGLKWTEVGTTGMAVTERLVQNEKMMECYCEKENKHEQDGWNFSYSLTRSDGLKLSDIRFRDQPLFEDIRMVDWHVSYSTTDGFGYSDAIGCPEYSQAAVVAIEPPYFEPILNGSDTLGFRFVQKYFSEGWPTPCSYNYQQHFEFYRDGSFRPVVGSLGRGCGNDGTYRPVTRIALAGREHSFESLQEGSWKAWEREAWQLEDDLTEYEEGKYFARILSKDKPWLRIEAAKGQFGDGGRGDRAYYYITRRHRDRNEGETDLPTVGPCCNTDHRQGPEKFIESGPEPIRDTELVLWYVPQLKNDNTPGSEYCWAESVLENGVYVAKVYPCFSGPKFHLSQP